LEWNSQSGFSFQKEASKVTRIWAEQPKNCGFIPSEKESFFYSMASSADLGPLSLLFLDYPWLFVWGGEVMGV
jgi:hypothetical protein